MDSAFNPYLKWLGIPLKDQPPNHYRLLGLELFEADGDIIERAADRQMTYVRSLQNGEHAKAAQRLLNELSLAKVCLLSADKKQQYDQSLRVDAQEKGLQPAAAPAIAVAPADSSLGLSAVAPAARRVAKPPPARPADSDASSSAIGLKTAQAIPGSQSATPVINLSTTTDNPAESSEQSEKKSSLPFILAAGGAVAAFLLLGGLALAFMWPSDNSNFVAQVNPGTQTAGESDEGANGRREDGSLRNPNPPSRNDTRNEARPGNNATTGNGKRGESNNQDVRHNGNTSAPVRTQGASLLIEAPFLLGTLGEGNPVLSDRTYSFADVDDELADLQFTRWRYGPVQDFSFDVTRPGKVYLIIPPKEYAEEIPQVDIEGWTATDLSCTVRGVGGLEYKCLVYSRDESSGSRNVVTGPVWPILAARKLEKKARILADIVANGTDEDSAKITPRPPTGGNNNTTGNRNPANANNKPPKGNNSAPPREPAKADTLAKLPIPPTAEQQPIRDRIAEVFELSTIRETDEKLNAAKRMFEVGREPSDNHVERFVMLSTAARLAAESGDLFTSLRAVEQIDNDYDARATAMRLYLLREFAKSRATKNAKAKQWDHVLPVLDEGIANDEFDAVEDAVAEFFKNGLGHKDLSDRRKIARERKSEFRAVLAAKETLVDSPDDPTANRIVGEYACFQKLDWDTGLPMLVKGDEAGLRDLAKSDLDNPEEGDKQVDIGEGWYKIALDQESDHAKGALLTRAEDWFRKAESEVKGLDSAHVKKRLDEIQSDLEELGWISIPKKAFIAATAGYGCEIYLNGVEIIDASYDVDTANVTLNRGDILMVRARKSTSSSSSYNKGFACVITYEGSSTPIVTGSSRDWQAFVPSNTSYWYKPENVARTIPYVISPSAGHFELNQRTGVASRSLWYVSTSSSEAYFYYRVR